MTDIEKAVAFLTAREAGADCFQIADMGGCPICWGKGKWLGITDANWNKAGRNAERTEMSCSYCRGTGLDHHPTHARGSKREVYP